MHEIYVANRHRVLTQVTMNGMLEKRIELIPARMVRVRFAHSTSKNLTNAEVRQALRSLYHQLLNSDSDIESSINECKTLECLDEVVRFDLISVTGENHITACRHRAIARIGNRPSSAIK